MAWTIQNIYEDIEPWILLHFSHNKEVPTPSLKTMGALLIHGNKPWAFVNLLMGWRQISISPMYHANERVDKAQKLSSRNTRWPRRRHRLRGFVSTTPRDSRDLTPWSTFPSLGEPTGMGTLESFFLLLSLCMCMDTRGGSRLVFKPFFSGWWINEVV